MDRRSTPLRLIPFILSTMSICSIEQVAEATGRPFWFQLYVIRDRGFSKDILARAANVGCNVLVLTVDLQVLGQRHRDIKNGMTVPPQIRIKNIIDIASKPNWALSILLGKRKTFGNLAGHVQGMGNVNELALWVQNQFDPALSWKDVEWIQKIWPGKLILKGILDPEDAKTAVKLGADAVVVSNHGGRQLDGAPSSISALREPKRSGCSASIAAGSTSRSSPTPSTRSTPRKARGACASSHQACRASASARRSRSWRVSRSSPSAGAWAAVKRRPRRSIRGAAHWPSTAAISVSWRCSPAATVRF